MRLPFFLPEFESEVWKSEYTVNDRSLPEYKLKPVDLENAEIRLVELFPSPKRYGEIRCRIFHVLLDSNPVYDSVSYASKLIDTIGYIRANGLLLPLPSAVIESLRNVRAKGGTRGRVLFLWDIMWEPDIYLFGWKLRLNYRIFKQAQQVAIGLGGDDREKDHCAIEFVREFESMLASGGATAEFSTNMLTRSHKNSSNSLGNALLQLFQRPWWRRIWPVHELVLPRKATLSYGDEAITFDGIQTLFSNQQAIRNLIGDWEFSMLESNLAWRGAQRISLLRAHYLLGHHLTLPELLWAIDFHNSSDRSDSLYAIYGLLEPEEQDSKIFTQDPHKSVEENFIDVAVYIVNRYQNLDILSYASHHRPVQPSLPSWVPVFSVAGDDVYPLVQSTFGPPGATSMFNAGGIKSDHPVLAGDFRSLIVRGYQFDEVQTLFRASDDAESRSSLLDLYTAVKQRTKITPEIFWGTVQADQRDNHRIGKANAMTDPALRQDGSPESGFCKGRRLVLTLEGHLCFAPGSSQMGDKIVVLVGGKVPYMLRKMADGFKVIGEWFVCPDRQARTWY